jgi:uncharacterized membrane protein YphA (DoxX/SURF4 family)
MKFLLSNDFATLFVRVFVGFVFVVASIDKISDPQAFAVSVANYKLTPAGVDLLAATILPWVELLSGLGIITGTLFRGSSLIACILSVVFALAVLSALIRGLDISCGCFSQDPDVGKINWVKLVENLGLVALSFFLVFSTSDKFGLDAYLRTPPPKEIN